jgi:hypothetical protein
MLPGTQGPSKQGFLLELSGRPHPLCWLREPLQIADEPHIRPATNPLKEVDDTEVPSSEGLGIAIAGI